MPRSGPYRNISRLYERIDFLERKKNSQENQIREAVREIREDLKPANILKNSFQSVFGDRGTRHSVLKTGVGILGAILLKKYLSGNQSKTVAKVINAGMKLGLAEAAVNHAEPLKEWAESLLRKVFSVKKEKETTDSSDKD